MLDEKDLEMLTGVFTKIVEPIKTDISEMKSEMTEMKSDIAGVKSEIAELKSMNQIILDEIGREHDILVKRIEKVQENLD